MAKEKKVRRVPNLRFKGFEGEWEENRLGDVCEIKTGNKDTQDRIENGRYPFFVRSNTVERINSYSYDGEAILTSGDGVGVGKNFHYINGKFDFHQRVYSLRKFKTGYNGKYIYYLFSDKFYGRVIRLSAKNSVDSVRMDMIAGMKIYFPEKIEQQKISSFLSLIDERITTQIKIIEELELLKDTASTRIFTRKLKFTDIFGNSYPDWQNISLGEIGETYNGLTGKTKDDFGKGKPYIQYKQIFDNSKIDVTTCELVDVKENENQHKVKKGDIFFTISSETPEDIGMSSVLLDEAHELYLNSFCFGYRPKSMQVLFPNFARYLFRSTTVRNEIVKLAQGSTRYNMSKVSLMKLKVNLPCIDEQHKIANFLTSLDDKISVEQSSLEKLRQQKQFLLSNLFI